MVRFPPPKKKNRTIRFAPPPANSQLYLALGR